MSRNKKELGARSREPRALVECAHCHTKFEQSDLGMLTDAIMQQKPSCSYECNKALGQVK